MHAIILWKKLTIRPSHLKPCVSFFNLDPHISVILVHNVTHMLKKHRQNAVDFQVVFRQ